MASLVGNEKAKLLINGSKQETLIVSDLSHSESSGAVGWGMMSGPKVILPTQIHHE